MVQLEVAERLAAAPGSKVYGVPSVKAAWYADVRRAGRGRPDRVLAGAQRRLRPGRDDPARARRDAATASEVFAVVDAAFAQRRKTLRAALAGWAGSPAAAEAALRAAGRRPDGARRSARRSRTSPGSRTRSAGGADRNLVA